MVTTHDAHPSDFTTYVRARAIHYSESSYGDVLLSSGVNVCGVRVAFCQLSPEAYYQRTYSGTFTT